MNLWLKERKITGDSLIIIFKWHISKTRPDIQCIYASLNIEAINFSLYFLQDHNQRDLRGVCTAIQSLREICNTPVVSRLSSPESSRTLPSWCYLDKTQHQQWSNIQQYNPLENISLEHINLVFLCQEMTTTGMTNLIWCCHNVGQIWILNVNILKYQPYLPHVTLVIFKYQVFSFKS